MREGKRVDAVILLLCSRELWHSGSTDLVNLVLMILALKDLGHVRGGFGYRLDRPAFCLDLQSLLRPPGCVGFTTVSVSFDERYPARQVCQY